MTAKDLGSTTGVAADGNCGHAMWWQNTRASKPKCMECSPPPNGVPRRVGVLAPDGKTVLTQTDIAVERIRREREAKLRQMAEFMGVEMNRFELVEFQHIDDGWPRGCYQPVDYAGHPLVGQEYAQRSAAEIDPRCVLDPASGSPYAADPELVEKSKTEFAEWDEARLAAEKKKDADEKKIKTQRRKASNAGKGNSKIADVLA